MKPYKPSSSSLLLPCAAVASFLLLAHPQWPPWPPGALPERGTGQGHWHPAPSSSCMLRSRVFPLLWELLVSGRSVCVCGGACSPHTPLKVPTQHSSGTQPCRVPPQSPVRGHGLTPGRWAAPSPLGRGRAGGSEQPHGQNRVAPMGKPRWVPGRQPGAFPGAGRAGTEGWGFPPHPCHEFWPQLCPQESRRRGTAWGVRLGRRRSHGRSAPQQKDQEVPWGM